MAASLSGVFNLQVLTSDGQPASGHRLYSHIAGTTTHKVAYTNAAGTVSHTYVSDGSGGLYIALDARGELPYPLFLTSGAYDLTLKTSAGATVWTRYAKGGDDVALSSVADLASTASAAVGAGLVGSLWTLNYVAGTIGNDVRYAGIPSIFRVLSQAQQQDVLNYAFTLDLYATIAAAFVLCKTWYFPPGGYKITDEFEAMTGMRAIGGGNGDRFYGSQPTTATPTRFWQATSGKAVWKIGVGVSDVVISDMCLSPVQTPAAYTAYTASTYGIRMIGAAYVAAGTAIQQAGRSSYRIQLKRLTGYQLEKFISCEDYYWESTGLTPPNSGNDWQCDAVDIEQCHSFSCLHHTYLNTTNADSWNIKTCTATIWTGGSGLYLKRSGYITANSFYWVPAESSAGVMATNTTGLAYADYPDTVTLINCSGSDSLTYFLDVFTDAGYQNVYQQINMIGCATEAAIRVQRQCKIVSTSNRFTDDATCSGDDIEVISTGDSWSPTTKKFVMSGLRPRLFVAPGSSQTFGTVATTTGVAATAFSLPASAGMYRAYAYLENGGAIYCSYAVLVCDGTTLQRIDGVNGANLTITVSSRNVQVTQVSGVNQTITYRYFREA